MAKPPEALAGIIRALPQADAHRPPCLLHMTLLPLGDRGGIDAGIFALIRAVLDGIALAPFRVLFDRIHDSGRTIALRPSEPLAGAIAFQHALAAAFGRHGLRVAPPYVFRPHLTLAYRSRAPGSIAIDPVSWRVEDIRLIESIVGETRHVEHGRWMLDEAGASPQPRGSTFASAGRLGADLGTVPGHVQAIAR